MTKKQAATQAAPQQPVAPQSAPAMPQGYDQAQYAAYQQPVDPNKGKAKWLTLEYAGAMASAVAAALLTTFVVTTVFNMWAGTLTPSAGVSGFLAAVLSVDMVTMGTDLVAAGVLAVLLSVLSFVLFGRVSRAIPDREGYTGRTAYKVVTYGAMAIVAAAAIVLLAKIATVLIASLLFIGLPGADKVYLSLYVGEFLPYSVGLALLIAVAWMVKCIIGGRNTSRALTMIVLGASSAVLLASAITIAVKVHNPDTKQYRSATPERMERYTH
ncbi:MAG: hypothetical protein Q4A37_01725 [Candidatus Saccharibacteria bacterium]|nr:hypothetical protein [Candidatus Saccharibacteria bacterium]